MEYVELYGLAGLAGPLGAADAHLAAGAVDLEELVAVGVQDVQDLVATLERQLDLPDDLVDGVPHLVDFLHVVDHHLGPAPAIERTLAGLDERHEALAVHLGDPGLLVEDVHVQGTDVAGAALALAEGGVLLALEEGRTAPSPSLLCARCVQSGDVVFVWHLASGDGLEQIELLCDVDAGHGHELLIAGLDLPDGLHHHVGAAAALVHGAALHHGVVLDNLHLLRLLHHHPLLLGHGLH